MKKLYLHNPTQGKNKDSFRMLYANRDLFADNSIYIANKIEVADYILVGSEDLMDKKADSIDRFSKPLELIQQLHAQNKRAQFILLDSNDSTSISVSYTLLLQLCRWDYPVKWLLKNQKLPNELYKNIYPTGRWWFDQQDGPPPREGDVLGTAESEIDECGDKIQLTGWNIGNYSNAWHQFYPTLMQQPQIDLCAVYQHTHDENYEFGLRNDTYYTAHRSKPYEILKDSKFNIATGKLPKSQYIQTLLNSKFCLSPFGMGEICYRDFEAIQYGIPVIKPNMDNVLTEPNIWYPYDTYIPVNADWSNLVEVLEEVVGDYDRYKGIGKNIQNNFLDEYRPQAIVDHWLNNIL